MLNGTYYLIDTQFHFGDPFVSVDFVASCSDHPIICTCLDRTIQTLTGQPYTIYFRPPYNCYIRQYIRCMDAVLSTWWDDPQVCSRKSRSVLLKKELPSDVAQFYSCFPNRSVKAPEASRTGWSITRFSPFFWPFRRFSAYRACIPFTK